MEKIKKDWIERRDGERNRGEREEAEEKEQKDQAEDNGRQR